MNDDHISSQLLFVKPFFSGHTIDITKLSDHLCKTLRKLVCFPFEDTYDVDLYENLGKKTIIEVESLRELMSDWAPVYGYLTETITFWKEFLNEISKQNNGVDNIEFHFYCEEYRALLIIGLFDGKFKVFESKPNEILRWFNFDEILYTDYIEYDNPDGYLTNFTELQI